MKTRKAGGSVKHAQAAVDWLRRNGSKAGRDGMARYAIPSDKAFGVSMKNIQSLAKQLGKDHELAGALWATGWYEARRLAESKEAAPRWVGKDALRELTSPAVVRRLRAKGMKEPAGK